MAIDRRLTLLLVLLLVGPGLLVWWTDRAYLPRHLAAHDLPWARAVEVEVDDAPDNRQMGDKIRMIWPDQVGQARALRRGELPLWNARILGGVPNAASPMTAMFYPLNWVHAAVPDLDIPVVAATTQLLLAGLFAWLFLRAAGLPAAVALLGALAFAWSGWVAARLQNTPVVAAAIWLPLGLAGVEALFAGRLARGVLAVGFGIGMPWLAGFAQNAVLGNVATAVYVALRLSLRGRSAGVAAVGRPLLLFFVAASLGWLLAGVQICCTLEAMPWCARGSRSIEDLASEHLRPWTWLGLVLPRALGTPMSATEWPASPLARLLLGEGADNMPPSVANWGERTMFVGGLVLLLAVHALVRVRRPTVVALAGLAVIGAGMASSTTAIALYGRLPGLDFGAPARAILWLSIALPGLAAFGLHVLRTGPPPSRWWHRSSFCVALIAGLAASATGAHPGLRVDLLALSLQAGIGGVLFAIGPRWRGTVPLAIVAVAADLLAFSVPVNLPVPRADLLASTPALEFLSAPSNAGRILRVSATAAEAVQDRLDLLHPNLGTLFAIDDAQGYRELIPRHALAPWRELSAMTTPVGFVGLPVAAVESPVLDVAAVRWLVAARPIPALAERLVEPYAATRDLWIYHNPGALPRAWLASRAAVVDGDTALARIRGGNLDVPAEVLVDRLPAMALTSPSGTGSAQVEQDTGDELTIAVASSGAAFLVVADTWFPGWSAVAVDRQRRERPLEIVRAMGWQRAVAVDADVVRVVFRYRPGSWPLGVCMSLLGLTGLMVLAFCSRRGVASAAPASTGS